MSRLPTKPQAKLEKRIKDNSFRTLPDFDELIDFCSNDYLGLSRSVELFDQISKINSQLGRKSNGATGSRLISGNTELTEGLEKTLASFFKGESALLFNSGYSANQGVLSALPQKGDLIIYDELVHASIKDGIRLSFADKVSFKHNDLDDLKSKILRPSSNTYVVVESIYSMDGDICPLKKLSKLCDDHGAYLILDEAHSVGVIGNEGKGLCIAEEVEDSIFARIYTFGKAFGVHGACVVGSQPLIDYLVNFSRPFIYTTAMPDYSINAIESALVYIRNSDLARQKLNDNITYFKNSMEKMRGSLIKNKIKLIESSTAIQGVVIPDNVTVREKAAELQKFGLDIRAILSPTVKVGVERLRICLHTYNTHDEIDLLINKLI